MSSQPPEKPSELGPWECPDQLGLFADLHAALDADELEDEAEEGAGHEAKDRLADADGDSPDAGRPASGEPEAVPG